MDQLGSTKALAQSGPCQSNCKSSAEIVLFNRVFCHNLMPQQNQTNMYEGLLAETVTVKGHAGKFINAYFARPLGRGPFPGVVVIHHAPGWDEWTKEATRRFAYHGYLTISPNIYFDAGHGVPEDVATKVRSSGGVRMTTWWLTWRAASAT